MPRSVQAFKQNATVTNSPANVSNGDPSSAVDDGSDVFKIPPTLDVCNPATSGTRNPFISGLNDMGSDTGNSTGVAGQTGNIMSGFQIFSDTLCGQALGGASAREVIDAWRQIRERNGNPRETYRAMRRLRDAAGAGTTPQSVIAGVEGVTGVINDNPVAQDAIDTGRQQAGLSGNQIIDAMNGAQVHANKGHKVLTGQDPTGSGASGSDLIDAGTTAMGVNTAKHTKGAAISTAQSVVLKQENLLVSQNFSGSYTVVPDALGRWSWDGTDGAETMGCLAFAANGTTSEFLSSEVDVVPGETIEVSCFIKTVGLTYTGTLPATFGVQKYRQMKNPDGSTIYADVGFYIPSTGQIASPAASSNWTGVAATYTVEPGVDQLRFLFKVSATATSGTVKFDEAEFLKLDLIPDSATPGIGHTRDNIVTQLYGAGGAGFNDNAAAVALASTRDALTSVTAQVSALQAEGHTGAIAGDDFSWSGSISSNADWKGTFTPAGSNTKYFYGSYRASKGDLVWDAGFNNQSCLFTWLGSNSVSDTDYQLVQLVLDSAIDYADGSLLQLPNLYAYVILKGRENSAGTSYTTATIGSDGTWSVDYKSGSSLVNLGSGTGVPVPGGGSILSFYLGDATTSSPRHYRIDVGGNTIAEFDEIGSASPLGASNRQWGFGGTVQAQAGYGAVLPDLNSWLAMDQ